MLGLDSDEPPGHPIEELVGLGLPTSRLYFVRHCQDRAAALTRRFRALRAAMPLS